MKTKSLVPWSLAALALVLGGCASSTAPLPQIHYPVTYQVPIGNTQVTSQYGPQNLTVNATQDVMVQPGVPLYYQVSSPVNVTVYVYEKTGAAPGGNLLGQMSGTAFNSSITPEVSTLEFVFSASQANTTGNLQFTLSDQPITYVPPPSNAQPGPAPVQTMPATYQVMVGSPNSVRDIPVTAGVPVYYQVNAPAPVTVMVYDKMGGPPGTLLGQMSGNSFSGSVTPQSSLIEFTFSSTRAPSETVQFTVSNQPLSQ